MTVYRRGEEWWYHFWYRGQHVQKRTRSASKREAKSIEANHKAQLILGLTAPGQNVSLRFSDFAADYLNYSKANKISYGVEYYYVNRTLIPFFGSSRIANINALEVERFKQRRLKDGLKKSSINREVGLLKSMLRTAMEWGLTNSNAARGAKLFKLDELPSDRVLSIEEEVKLLEACDQAELRHRAPHLKLIVLIAIHLGLRRGEILRLKWSDVDLQSGHLTVRKSKTKAGTGRRVYLNSLLQRTLDGLFQVRSSDWMFPSPERFQEQGTPERHIADVKNSFRRAVRLSGIQPITFHQLRHTFCSRLADAGVPMPVIQDLAGHASILMTRRYTHPSPELKRRAVEMLVREETNLLPATGSATEAYRYGVA